MFNTFLDRMEQDASPPEGFFFAPFPNDSPTAFRVGIGIVKLPVGLLDLVSLPNRGWLC